RPGGPELLKLGRRGRELVVADHLLEREIYNTAARGPQVAVAAVASDTGAEAGQEVAALVVGDGRRRPRGPPENRGPLDPDRFVDVPVSVQLPADGNTGADAAFLVLQERPVVIIGPDRQRERRVEDGGVAPACGVALKLRTGHGLQAELLAAAAERVAAE